jgi:UDPglucose--hexose-1-phosphate uridylyltransferase
MQSTDPDSLRALAGEAAALLQQRWGQPAAWLAVAPGRVNLIGEHTDYNGGFVLPMAIDRHVVVAAAPAPAGARPRLRVWSRELQAEVEVRLDSPVLPAGPAWANYVRGVVDGCLRRGLPVPALDMVVVSDLPLGGGLSSSAALEVATATALEAACGTAMSPVDKAHLCQEAEQRFAGVPCGIMDQLASSLGDASGALLVDCESEAVRLVPLPASELALLVSNSQVTHALADGAYALRRAECASAARILGVASLRAATVEAVEAARQQLGEPLYRRARHVTSENARTLAAAEALDAGDHRSAGLLMYESHRSLREDYEVSCHELDVLVDIAREMGEGGGVWGARLTGGGFGGCTITLVRADQAALVAATLSREYTRRTGKQTTPFLVRPAQGAHLAALPVAGAEQQEAVSAPGFDPTRHPHRRLNLLSGQWVLVSPHRLDRPWQGRTEPPPPTAGRPAHDPECYLCPGNRRAGGEANPDYRGTFVFDNDFSALRPEVASGPPSTDPLLRSQVVAGICRVVCFSPRHDLTLAELPPAEIEAVIATFAEQSAELGARYPWVQAFENKGEIMGCSNPHPHGQIWASSTLPKEAADEDARQRAYHGEHGRPLLADYAERERAEGVRVVLESPGFLVVVPYWAVWPFETLILSRQPVTRLPDLDPAGRVDLAQTLGRLLRAYDRLFQVSFPYSLGWHGAPFSADPHPHWVLHGHVYPPLLRSATVKKFMVGYEMLAEPQRDITPEAAAERLRQAMTP